MKITDSDYAQLRELVAALDVPDARARYRARDIPRGELVRDIDRRYRWDLYHAAVSGAFASALYAYLDDTHLDTALRRIVPSL